MKEVLIAIISTAAVLGSCEQDADLKVDVVPRA